MAYDRRTYNSEYDKAHQRRISVAFHDVTDADIIEYLKTVKNVNGLIKKLIRQEMKQEEGENSED